MDKTQDKMNYVTKKLSTLLKTSDMGALYTIMCLSLILFILVVMVICTWVYLHTSYEFKYEEDKLVFKNMNSLLIVKFL